MKLNLGWLLVFSMVIWAIALPLFQNGMFVDGILYATVSRNLALGDGTFWDPFVSKTFMQHFHEQPPLVFWLQALLFKLDSHSIYPERIYSFCFLLLSLWGITKFWKELSSQYFYWPLLLFISIPTIRWGFTNNVLENTMLFFDLMAVYFFYLAMKKEKGLWYLLAGVILTFLASFSKGIQGLFPLAVPIIYSFTYNHKQVTRKAWLHTFMALVGIIIIYAALLMSNDARESYRLDFEQRFDDFPETKNANTDNRFKILYYLAIEMAIPILLCGIVLLISRINNSLNQKTTFAKNENTWFLLLVGITASFPLMITFEQRGFYINTSLPYYVLALSYLSQPWLAILQSKLLRFQNREFVFKSLVMFSCFIGIITTMYFAGKPKRDAEKLHDIHMIGKNVGHEGNVCTLHEWDDWSMRYYFARHYQISVTGVAMDCPLILLPKADTTQIPAEYHKADFPTHFYTVYQK